MKIKALLVKTVTKQNKHNKMIENQNNIKIYYKL